MKKNRPTPVRTSVLNVKAGDWILVGDKIRDAIGNPTRTAFDVDYVLVMSRSLPEGVSLGFSRGKEVRWVKYHADAVVDVVYPWPKMPPEEVRP